jgi:tRNA/rRNA methyltransferase
MRRHGANGGRKHGGASAAPPSAAVESPLQRVRVVLVRPRGAANVGAAARAMKNMGLRELFLVRPAVRRRSAATMAVHARDLLDGAAETPSIEEAVADCGLVVGTTCRRGLYRAAAQSPESLAPLILERARCARVALLFGPEDHGLSNDDLKVCQRLVCIDADRAYPSLNLAQAVLLCCYELRRAARGATAVSDPIEPAPAADVDFMLGRLQAALLRIGFLHPQNPDHIMFAFRRIFGRSGLEEHDVRILLGLARQIDWYARHGWRREAVEEGAQREER